MEEAGIISIDNGLTKQFVRNVWDEIRHKFSWEQLTALMDEDVMKTTHYRHAPCRNKTFLNKYCVYHKRHFGEIFTIG